MSNDQQLDMSVKDAPESWLEAEHESPTTPDGRALQKAQAARVPIGKRVSLFSTLIAGLLGGLVGGTAWYLMETQGVGRTPWIAVAIGLLIPVLIRLAAGGADSSIRAGVSLLSYFFTLCMVMFLLTRLELIGLYGEIPSLSGFEQQVLRRRFSRPTDLLAYALGAVCTIQVSILLRDSTPRR